MTECTHNVFDTAISKFASATSDIENSSRILSELAFGAMKSALTSRLAGNSQMSENSDSRISESSNPNRFGDTSSVLSRVTSDIVQKNVDMIANIVSKLPDQMFPLDAEKLPLLKLGGVDRIEKNGSKFTLTMDGAKEMTITHPPVEGISFDKTLSFDVKNDPQTGAAKFDNIQGIHVKANVLGLDVSLPIDSIEHTKAGDATFRVCSDLPTGHLGALNVDVSIDKTGHVNVTAPHWQA